MRDEKKEEGKIFRKLQNLADFARKIYYNKTGKNRHKGYQDDCIRSVK